MVVVTEVDLLRRAAETLRAHAEEAQHRQPWCSDYTWSAVRHVQRNCDFVECDTHGTDPEAACGQFDMYDGRYVALMHPPVALALAELLEDIAAYKELNPAIPGPTEVVLSVARAVLREPEVEKA